MADNTDREDNTEGLFDVMLENEYFQTVYISYENVKSFLQRDKKIYARSVTANKIEQDVFLKYSTDVDGCVVELKSLRGIKMPIRHLTMLHKGLASVRSIHSLLKKHMDLSLYSRKQLANFNQSVGFQFFYECGWEGWIGMVPCISRQVTEIRKEILKDLSYKYFQAIKTGFQEKLYKYCSSQTALRTLMKNDINHIEKMFILPDDSSAILGALQDSIEECRPDGDCEVILFCFRFGEKMTSGVSLKEFCHKEIHKVTVHSAIDLFSEDIDLFWSTVGLQAVVGCRGVLSTCVSFSDCGNYQSNIDGRAMDISKGLRSICHHPEKLRFLQLYADIAHHRPRTRFHPVSGSIAGGMVFPKQTSTAFKRDAEQYISSLQTNFYLMKRSTCRIECVTELTELKELVMANDCLDVKHAFTLLEQQPLLVPFPKGIMKYIQEVGLWLTSELTGLLENFSSTGNIGAIWQAFQLELAAEKMIWGHPLCFLSHLYSVNLGPGKLEPSRSITDQLGFLALDRWTACMASEDSLPPCSIWTGSEMLAKKIQRSAGMHDILQSSGFVLGRRLLNTLIADLFEVGKVGVFIRLEDFKQDLFSDKPARVRVTGAVTVKQLVTILSSQRRLPVAMVYSSVCQLIQKSKIDLQSILKDGLLEMGLKHFPAIKTYDSHRNSVLCWSSRSGIWKIIGLEENKSEFRSSAGVLSMLVQAELERRNLVYISKLKKVPSTLPWINECTRKLSGENLSDENLVQVLSFVSCVALIITVGTWTMIS